jgi:hypothetical protein
MERFIFRLIKSACLENLFNNGGKKTKVRKVKSAFCTKMKKF